ncbi:MAG: hypothetical protein JWO94_2147 [Verrucomicrobiaceae bacterium]|nr:hypothetical protein [Verrucomicrobiaceae bacterium]
MNSTFEKFDRFLISRRADGSNVELRSSPAEVVLLAFDTILKRLVELHLLTSTQSLGAVGRAETLAHCRLATQVQGAACLRVLQAGEEDETVYFSCNLSEGELAEDYVARRGALPAVTVFCLMQQFVEDLLRTPKFDQLMAYMSLANPLVTTLEDSFLQLRIVDYHLAAPELDALGGSRRVVAECYHLLFLLLTGQPFEGQNPDQVPALTCLPTSLRSSMRAALIDADQASPHLEKLRDEVREAYASLVSNLQMRVSRRHIVVTDSLQPRSQLQEMLLEQVPLAELLNGRFEVLAGEDSSRHPFSIAAVNVKTEQPVTVHLLPPAGIVPRDQYEAVPLQMWRFNLERHPNILRSLSVWENPAWTFLTEEREPGFSVGRLMAERITLNPTEVIAVLRQVRAGLDQAMECGVRSADLHPSNLMLNVGKGGPTQAREFERLMQKRIDAWPPFLVKLRTHMTMRSLYEPPLVEFSDAEADRDLHLAERELRHCAFLGLAVYLLTGERQAGRDPDFGESVSEPLANYLHGALETARHSDRAPSPGDFVNAFELYMGQTGSEGRGIAAIMAASAVTGGEIEDAGTISDFDEDWSQDHEDAPPVAPPNYLLTGSSTRKSFNINPPPSPQKTILGRTGVYVWAASFLSLLVLVRLVLSGVGHSAVTEPPHAADTFPTTSAAKLSLSQAVAARFSSAPDVASHNSAPANKPALQPTPSSTPANAPLVIGLSVSSQASQEASESPITIKKAIVPSTKEVGDAKSEQEHKPAEEADKSPSVDVVDGAFKVSH